MANSSTFRKEPKLPKGYKRTKLRLLSDGLPMGYPTANINKGEGTYLITEGNEIIEGVRRINIDLKEGEFATVIIELNVLKAELHYPTDTEPFRHIRVEEEGEEEEVIRPLSDDLARKTDPYYDPYDAPEDPYGGMGEDYEQYGDDPDDIPF